MAAKRNQLNKLTTSTYFSRRQGNGTKDKDEVSYTQWITPIKKKRKQFLIIL